MCVTVTRSPTYSLTCTVAGGEQEHQHQLSPMHLYLSDCAHCARAPPDRLGSHKEEEQAAAAAAAGKACCVCVCVCMCLITCLVAHLSA